MPGALPLPGRMHAMSHGDAEKTETAHGLPYRYNQVPYQNLLKNKPNYSWLRARLAASDILVMKIIMVIVINSY